MTRANDETALRILLVSTADQGGGAEASAWNVFNGYRKRGHNVSLAVGTKRTDDPDVLLIPNDSSRTRWAKTWLGLNKRLRSMTAGGRMMDRVDYLLRLTGEPRRWLEIERGHEDFHFPGTSRLLQLSGSPQIIHCFNLHGGYFDLRKLAWLSHQRPVILDLRDCWLLSGHCAHSLDCERWKTGCGDCPDLSIYPLIVRDGTAYNWRRKKEIYARSRLHVSAPCQWLMDKVKESMLAPSVIESRIITTGVDSSVFHSFDKGKAREILNLPQDAKILLFAANRIQRNRWKDYPTIHAAISRLSHGLSREKILFLALGEDGPSEQIGTAEIRFIAHEKDQTRVARYYQAADIYIHAAHADTFPRVILEALACATPVIATAVGGIVEQIRGLAGAAIGAQHLNTAGPESATGVLVPKGDAGAMAAAIEKILENALLRRRMSENAAQDAVERFSLEVQMDRYLSWYRELVEKEERDPAKSVA
jgi:glycosyltransferase involved in cell wall biosynthesis